MERASNAIGTQVEVISGREESRLIHLGVQARWPHPNRRLLIVDIGGGSAELIAGENGKLRDSFSKPLGAVRLREIFLRNDPPLPDELHRMHEYIEEKLAGIGKRFGNTHWDRVVATSASASAVVCAVNRIPRIKRDQADRMRASAHEVRRLYKKLSVLDLADRRKATGIGPKRAEIIVPGVSVLTPRFFNEIAVRLPGDAAAAVEAAAGCGVIAGVPYSRLAPNAGRDDVLLVAATELTTDADIAALAAAIAQGAA